MGSVNSSKTSGGVNQKHIIYPWAGHNRCSRQKLFNFDTEKYVETCQEQVEYCIMNSKIYMLFVDWKWFV